MKVLIIILSLILFGCGEDRKYTYIETERGIVSYSVGYCTLGMLTNNDRDNIYDENNKPITCTGYIELTKKERAAYDIYKT